MPPQTPTNVNPGALVGLVITLLVLVALVLHWLLMRVRQGNLREGLRGLGQILRKEAPVLSAMFQGAAPAPVAAPEPAPAPAYDHAETLYRLVVQEAQRQADSATEEAAPEPEPTPEPEAEAPQEAPVVFEVESFEPAVVVPVAASSTPSFQFSDDIDLSALGTQVPTIKLSELVRADNIAIVGNKGAGKTTLLRTIAEARNGERIAFDPHNSPGKWPFRVVGGGSKFLDIAHAFEVLNKAMVERSEALDKGEVNEGDFPRRTVVSDEFFSITSELKLLGQRLRREKGREAPYVPDIGNYLLSRIVQGRKFGECVVVVSHNDTLAGLGLPDGAADMKTCFDYFIYGGGFVALRCSDKAVREAALKRERPLVAYDTERDQWFVLDFDLEPITKEIRLHAPDEAPNSAPNNLTNGINSQPNNAATGATVLQPFNSLLPALESQTPNSNTVNAEPKLTENSIPTAAEVVKITQLLTSGIAPSVVARQLPGYDPKKNYHEYKAKVAYVAELLKDQVAA